MAERPIFCPQFSGPNLVAEVFLSLTWHSGFAAAQKERNIRELHAAAAGQGIYPVMEVSTKASLELGQQLSAFNLQMQSERYGWLPIESIFQGSKVFENGGPYRDLYNLPPREARADSRLKTSGKIIGFEFDDERFPSEPKTLFYDWLYLQAIYINRNDLLGLDYFAAFSDIEFNPYKSINCQARSVALFRSLKERQLLAESLKSVSKFRAVLLEFNYEPQIHEQTSHVASRQLKLTPA